MLARASLELISGPNVLQVHTTHFALDAVFHRRRWWARLARAPSRAAPVPAALTWSGVRIGRRRFPFRRMYLVSAEPDRFEVRFDTAHEFLARCHVLGRADETELTLLLCADSPVEMALPMALTDVDTGLAVDTSHGAQALRRGGITIRATHPLRTRRADTHLGRGIVMSATRVSIRANG